MEWIKPHVSYSQINSFYNYRSYFVENYIHKITKPGNEHMEFGKQFSEVIDSYCKTGSYVRPANNVNYIEVLQKVQNVLPFELSSADTEKFITYDIDYLNTLVGYNLPFIGYIDLTKDNLIVDFKTGKLWTEQDVRDSKQLLLYAYWHYLQYKIIPKVGIVSLPCQYYAGIKGLQFTGDVSYITYQPTIKEITDAVDWLVAGVYDALQYIKQNYSTKSSIDDKLIKKLLKAKAKIEEYKEIEESCRKQLEQSFIDAGIDRYDAFPGVMFYKQTRNSYKHTENVKVAENALKSLKEEEIKTGVATIEKQSVYFTMKTTKE
jgi:ubiquitin